MTSPRIHGQRISPSQRLAYAAELRRLWHETPTATIAELCAATGSPVDLAQDVRKRLVVAGVVPVRLPAREERRAR